MKSYLEALVPPRKLCQMIPEGCFADSALVHAQVCDGRGGVEWYVMDRENAGATKPPGALPTPTLEEIMLALSEGELNSTIACREKSVWQINVEPASEENGKEEQGCSFEASNKKSGATAALILWLKRYLENYGGEE